MALSRSRPTLWACISPHLHPTQSRVSDSHSVSRVAALYLLSSLAVRVTVSDYPLPIRTKPVTPRRSRRCFARCFASYFFVSYSIPFIQFLSTSFTPYSLLERNSRTRKGTVMLSQSESLSHDWDCLCRLLSPRTHMNNNQHRYLLKLLYDDEAALPELVCP